jgi:hypothetical protein
MRKTIEKQRIALFLGWSSPLPVLVIFPCLTSESFMAKPPSHRPPVRLYVFLFFCKHPEGCEKLRSKYFWLANAITRS